MAQTTGIINGSDLLLYIGGIAVAHATNHTLSIGVNARDASTKSSSGWRDLKPGQRQWSISGEHLYTFDASYGATALFSTVSNRSLITLKLASGDDDNQRFSGSGYLTSLEMNFPNEENSTFSFTIEGTGELSESTGS